MQRRVGFTLIELLVVIAIIAILAAILFPVFARARAKAQQNNCLSNIKQLSLGVIMYASDYDDRFPPAWSTWGDRGDNWAAGVYPYVKNLQIYTCPATNFQASYNEAGYGYGINNKITGHSYTMNACLGSVGATGYGCSYGAWPPITQSAVLRPAELIMLRGTEVWSHFYCANPDASAAAFTVCADPFDYNCYNPTYAFSDGEQRHNNGGNVSYCDGHAKWLSRDKLYSWAAADLVMWNNTP